MMRRSTSVAAALLLGACALLSEDREPDSRSPQYLDMPQVIVQVCLPKHTVAFVDEEIDLRSVTPTLPLIQQRMTNGVPTRPKDAAYTLPPKDTRATATVRRLVPGSNLDEIAGPYISFGNVLLRGGQYSAGAGSIHIWTETERGQPVFETQEHRPQDIVALHVAIRTRNEGRIQHTQYWYRLPKHVAAGTFSAWHAPISEESPEIQESQEVRTSWKLTHERPMDIHAVGPDAPKVRFMLATVQEYFDSNLLWDRSRKAINARYGKSADFVPKTAPGPAC